MLLARFLSILDPDRAVVVEELSKNIGLEGGREVVQERLSGGCNSINHL